MREDLRTRLYKAKDENLILRTALEDIARIDREGLPGQIATQRLKDLYFGKEPIEEESKTERTGTDSPDEPL